MEKIEMNICFIAPQVINTASGGLSIQVQNSAHFLEKSGVNISFFNPWEVYEWDKFDLVHIFRADFETYNIAQWLHESGMPFVVSPVFYNLHNTSLIRFSLFMSRTARNLFKGIRTDFDCLHDICQFSSKVLPNTNAEAEFIKECTGIKSQKIHVIHNGVEKRFANADPSLFTQKYGINNFILSVGNFGYKRKNMLNLICALEKIDNPAVLIGTINKNAYGIKCLEKIDNSKHILWIDAIDHNDPLLASAYAACKVFALPSYLETPGIAALEAALAGANIVITPHGGPKEYFKDMVVYVNPGNFSSIRECIIKALSKKNNPELKKHILNNYTWPTIAENILTVYREAINK